jgi:hypothetical protein
MGKQLTQVHNGRLSEGTFLRFDDSGKHLLIGCEAAGHLLMVELSAGRFQLRDLEVTARCAIFTHGTDRVAAFNGRAMRSISTRGLGSDSHILNCGDVQRADWVSDSETLVVADNTGVLSVWGSPCRRNSPANFRVLLQAPRSGDIGSQRVLGSTNASSASTRLGCSSCRAFLPPPSPRCRWIGAASGSSSSVIPAANRSIRDTGGRCHSNDSAPSERSCFGSSPTTSRALIKIICDCYVFLANGLRTMPSGRRTSTGIATAGNNEKVSMSHRQGSLIQHGCPRSYKSMTNQRFRPSSMRQRRASQK